jgi:putative membrane protein
VARSRESLERDLPELAEVWDGLWSDLAGREVSPVVVHGDVCPPNAYLSLGPAGPVVTGLGDFSPHTMQADALMDLSLAVSAVELEPYAEAAEDAGWLERVVLDRYGDAPVAAGELSRWLDVYRRFYGFYFSDACLDQPALYAWCLRQLRR